jgi:hypothetical protein
MNGRALLLGALLIHIGACGSSKMTSSVDSGGNDQMSETPDLREAGDQLPETTPIDAGREQPAPTCQEFPGCQKLIYGPDGCPIGCVVNTPADASAADAGTEAPVANPG